MRWCNRYLRLWRILPATMSPGKPRDDTSLNRTEVGYEKLGTVSWDKSCAPTRLLFL